MSYIKTYNLYLDDNDRYEVVIMMHQKNMLQVFIASI